MAVLITGASGFVGLAVTEALLEQGTDVIAFDRQGPPAEVRQRFAALAGRLIPVEGDVRSSTDLDRALRAGDADRVLHAAAITAGPERERADPESVLSVNVLGTVAALQAAARHRLARFVFVSSVAVYGAPPPGCAAFDEQETCPRPVTLYAISKLAAEQALVRLAQQAGLSFACARLGPVYGPCEPETGVRDTLSPHRAAMAAALCGEEAVLGPTSRGDHIYVRDAAAGLLALLAAPRLDQPVLNLGSGVVSDVAGFCTALASQLPRFRWRYARPGERPNVVSPVPFDRPAMAIGRIRAAVGFAPRFADPRRAVEDWLATTQT